MKFGLVFAAAIQVDELSRPNNTVEADFPLTMDLTVTRNTFASANTGRFVFYNLGQANRRRIFHDRYDTATIRQVAVQAGYVGQKPLPMIFTGRINFAMSHRQGSEWATEVEAFDGGAGILGTQTSLSVPAGAGFKDIVQNLAAGLKDVRLGAVGNFSNPSSRGASYSGNPWDIITGLARDQGGVAFIDNGVAHVLKKNEYVQGLPGIPLLNAQAGLLRAQRRFKGRVDVDLVFEPRLFVGQKVTLQTVGSDAANNGDYIVQGVGHRGIISGGVASKVTTTANLWQGGTPGIVGVAM